MSSDRSSDPICGRCKVAKSAHAAIRTLTSSYLRCPPGALMKAGCDPCHAAADDPLDLYTCPEHESSFVEDRQNEAIDDWFPCRDGMSHHITCGLFEGAACSCTPRRTSGTDASDRSGRG